jgi:23S rRNA (uracil1939-C5)-methyltransferase
MSEQVTLTPPGGRDETVIRSIAVGGNGVGRLPDGMTVFVPRTAPGDRVTLTSVVRKRRFATARIHRLIEAGRGRQEPPCPHYVADSCGACQLMHLDQPTQLAAKGAMVGDTLRRIGRLDIPDPAVEPTASPLGYRNKVSFAVRRGTIGYHRVGAPDDIFEVRRCLLLDEHVNRLHQHLRERRTLLPPDTVRVVLRRDAEGGDHLIVERRGAGRWRFDPALASSGATVWELSGSRNAPRQVAGRSREWSATAFEQVNRDVAAGLRLAAVDVLGDVSGRVAWDLYAGIGETSSLLAARGAVVESVELDAGAVAIAEQRGAAGVRRLVGDVAARMAELSAPAVVVTNPPRAGMGPAVTEGISRSGAARVVCISCDPATLARDLAALAPWYGVESIRSVDQFPQTAHVETLAVLDRRD